MRSASLAIAVLIIPIAYAQSPSKKQEQVPKAILISHYIYVEAWDGDFFNPHLLSDDRKAIVDVQDALRVWNRYAITVKRRDAELLFVVHKGRTVTVNGNVGGVGNGPAESGPHDERGSTQPKGEGGVKVGVGAELGSPDDLFYVYVVSQDGSLLGPIWKHHQKDGLDTPDIPLFKQFKESIEAASKVPASKSPTP